jgi:hypothetical protein
MYISDSQLGAISPPRICLTTFGITFGYHEWEGVCYCIHLCTEPRDAAKNPTMNKIEIYISIYSTEI